VTFFLSHAEIDFTETKLHSDLTSHAPNSQIVYSNVYPNKKTNQMDLTPSGWL
jgi:hypothetical protein